MYGKPWGVNAMVNPMANHCGKPYGRAGRTIGGTFRLAPRGYPLVTKARDHLGLQVKFSKTLIALSSHEPGSQSNGP